MVRRAWWQNTITSPCAYIYSPRSCMQHSPRAGILPSSPICTMLDPISNLQLHLIFSTLKPLLRANYLAVWNIHVHAQKNAINNKHRSQYLIVYTAYIVICNHWMLLQPAGTCPCSGSFLWISLHNWHFCSSNMCITIDVHVIWVLLFRHIPCLLGNTMHCHSNLFMLRLDVRNAKCHRGAAVVSVDGFSAWKM